MIITDNIVPIVNTVTLIMTETKEEITIIRGEMKDHTITIIDNMIDLRVIISTIIIKLDILVVVLDRSMNRFKTDSQSVQTKEILEATTIETIAADTITPLVITFIINVVVVAMIITTEHTEKKRVMKDHILKVRTKTSHIMGKR
jgi:preprotein translocase subunit SecG